jgi:hypothetical protein
MERLQTVARFAVLLLVVLLAPAARADDAQDRAAALAGTIDWVRQSGDDKLVPVDACARFLILCGPDGATFKFKSAKAAGGILRGFMWIGGRTALLTQTKKRAIYLVLNPEGEIIRIAVVNLADGKERKVRNDDPQFVKLLGLEIKFWQSQTPVGQ